MLATLMLFLVDLTLASAIVVTLYAVCLTAATGVCLSAIFYIFKGEMKRNCNTNKVTIWVPDSKNAAGKPLRGDIENVGPRTLPVHSPGMREGAFPSPESDTLF